MEIVSNTQCLIPCSSVSKETACDSGDLGLIPGLGRYPGEGNGNTPQYSCLENPVGRRDGRLQSIGRKSWTHLSTIFLSFNALEIPWVTLKVNDVPLSLCNDLGRPNLGMISWRNFFTTSSAFSIQVGKPSI